MSQDSTDRNFNSLPPPPPATDAVVNDADSEDKLAKPGMITGIVGLATAMVPCCFFVAPPVCIAAIVMSWLSYSKASGVPGSDTMKQKIGMGTGAGGIVIAMLFLCAGVASSPSSPATFRNEEGEVAAEVVRVTAQALYSEYESNEIAADAKYAGQPILVSGTVTEVGKDMFGNMYVSLKTNHIFGTVVCYFDDANVASLSKVKQGQYMNILGRCDGIAGNVNVQDCSFE